MRIIVKPNGRPVAIGEYVRCWRILKTAHPDALAGNWQHFPASASEILSDIRWGLHDRINRHLPWFNCGRKWSWQWQTETMRAAIALNTPRLAIHWLPAWLMPRFGHRISSLEL